MQNNEIQDGLSKACQITNNYLEKIYDDLIYRGKDRDTAIKCHAKITACESLLELFKNEMAT